MLDGSSIDGSRPGSSSDMSFATAETRERAWSRLDEPETILEEAKGHRDDATVVDRPSTAHRISTYEMLRFGTEDDPNGSARNGYKLDDRFQRVNTDHTFTEPDVFPDERDAEVKRLREELQQARQEHEENTQDAEKRMQSLVEEKVNLAQLLDAQLVRTRASMTNSGMSEGAIQRRNAELEVLLKTQNSELVKARTRVDNLEDTFLDHEIRRRDLVEQVDEHQRLLGKAQLKASAHSNEVSRLMQDHETISNERDEFKLLLQDALACTTALEQKLNSRQRRPSTRGEGSSKSRKSSRAADERLEVELAQRNEELAEIRVQVLSMQQQLSQSESRATELEEELEIAKAEAGGETDQDKDEVARLEQRIAELQQTHNDQLAQLEANRQLLEASSASRLSPENDQDHQAALQQAVDAATASSAAIIAAPRTRPWCKHVSIETRARTSCRRKTCAASRKARFRHGCRTD